MFSLLGDAITLMVTGMGFVFAFLGLMVFLVPYIQKIAPADAPASSNVRSNTNNGIAPDTIAAISAAIAQYRKRQN